MNDTIYMIITVSCLILFSFTSILYNTYTFKCNIEAYHNFKENFENPDTYKDQVSALYNTTLEAYKKGASFHDKAYRYLYNFHEYNDIKNNESLLTYGCIKSDTSSDILADLRSLFYVSYYEFYSVSVNDIIQKISEDLDKTIINSNEPELKDPIYVLIFQAPYLVFNNEQIVARHDSVNNMKSSYIQNKNNKEVGQKQLFTKVYIMYPNYYHDADMLDKIHKYPDDSGINKFKDYFNPKLSRKKLCFLECNGVNNLACGCLNRSESDGTATYYNSKCAELDDTTSDYGMIYSLNKMNRLFVNKLQKYNSFVL